MWLLWFVVLRLTLFLSLAAIILPAIFLVMTHRQPSKKKKRHDKAIESYQAALQFCSTNLDLLNLTSISSNSFLNSFYSSQSLLVKNLCPHIPGRRALFSFGIAPWNDQEVCFALCDKFLHRKPESSLPFSSSMTCHFVSFPPLLCKTRFFPAAACSTGSPFSFFCQ